MKITLTWRGRKCKLLKLFIESKYKICTKCNEEFIASEDNFYKLIYRTKTKGDYYKLSSWCKSCTKKKNREWYIANPEKVKISSDKYASKEEVKQRRRKRAAQARVEGKQKEWQRNNKDRLYEYGLEKRMNREHEISDTEWYECLDFFNNSCAYCGISEGEAFDEYGQLLHKEHVEHNGANDITNCIPSCKGCNSQKWEFQFNEWYCEGNPVFSKRRYNKIIKWIMSFAKVEN